MPARWTSIPAIGLLMLSLATGAAPAFAQQGDLEGYVKRYDDLFQAGNYDAALAEARKFESAARARGAQEAYAGALYLQARALYVLGKYPEAEKLYKLALPIFEKARPSAASARDLAKTLVGLGRVYEHQGRYSEAQTVQKRALSVVESSPDGDQMVVSEALEDLGNALYGEGRYAEAEDYYKRALAIREKGTDPIAQRAVSQTLNLVSNVYMRTGRFPEAEPLLKRAIDIQEKIAGQNHPDVAKSLTNLAELYRLMGRYASSEPLQRRALDIQEKSLGPEHPHVGVTLNNLALTYFSWGRYADALPLYLRSIAVQDKALGKDHPQVALSLNNLGLTYMRLGRYAEAEPVLKRALASREKILPKDHPDIGQSLGNLAADYRYAGRPAEGLPLLQRAVGIMEKNYGPNHLYVTYSLTATANAHVAMKRFAEGEPFAKRSLAIRQELGPDHTDVASVLKTLAQINLGTNRVAPAADYSRKAVQVAIRALKNGDVRNLGFDLASLREYFDVHLGVLNRAVTDGIAGKDAMAEAFETAQWANESAAAAALNQMAARTSAGNDALAELVRKQQDEAAELRSLDKSILAEVAKPADRRDPKREALVRQHRQEVEAGLVRASAQISTEFPDYADLVSPKPLSIAEAQKLLAADEALVLFHVSDSGNYVWAVTPDRVEWQKINLSRDELNDGVQKLRASVERVEIPERSIARAFDLDLAYSLYSALLGPVEPLLSSKGHLIVVPSGALTGLPLHLLLTDKPTAKPTVRDPYSAYRSAPWLMRRHAVTVLPSASSLKRRAESHIAPQPYLGFGDPLTQGRAAGARPRGATTRSSVTYSRLFREGKVDLASLREMDRLAESADELREIAKVLNVPSAAVKLGKDATEGTVKSTRLDDYRVIHFATHALVARETAIYTDMTEPALVFTPPQVASEEDDGLLTSSEIANLKLNADWVILSACNTADGDKPGAEALSGLARAFFYAGARSLLVSNWYLDTKAAVQLTTRTVQGMEHGKATPAQALRRAMLEFVDKPNNVDDPYPGVWAPFIVVGLPPQRRGG